MAFTMSKDGIERKTFRVSIRLTKDEIERYEAYGKSQKTKFNPDGLTVRDLFEDCLRSGLCSLEEQICSESEEK